MTGKAMQRALVTIVIPTHRPEHFKTALLCALSQTYANTEIIVSDNSGGGEIAEICARHAQVIYRRNDDGQLFSNIAQPLVMAKGDYIKYLFDDDLIYPHCIDTMMTMLDQCPPEQKQEIGLVTSSRHLIDGASVCFEELREQEYTGCTIVNGVDAVRSILTRQYNFIGEFSTILFRRDLIDTANPRSIFSVFSEEYPHGLIDLPLYMTILQKANLLYIPYSLSAFRLHVDGGSNPAANPRFHHVISDWFRLTRGAFEQGLLGADEAVSSTEKFLALAAQHAEPFGEQLAPWCEEAQIFIDGMETDRAEEVPAISAAQSEKPEERGWLRKMFGGAG